MASSIELAARLSAIVATQQDVLAAITDLEKVMALVVERTPEVTSGAGAIIEMLEGEELVCHAASGAAKEQTGARLSVAASLSGLALREKTLMRCENAEADLRVDGAACRVVGIRSMAVAPLLEGTAAVGVLITFSPHTRAFADLDTYALQLLAGMTSAALLQARTFRERQASEARYRMLFERNIAGVFRTTLDGRFLDCNEALAQYLGYDSRDDLLAQPVWDMYHQRKDREEFLRLMQESRSVINVRIPFRRKDGSSLLGLISASILPGDAGEGQLLGTIVEA